ncbi:AsmA-like C-terminal region-containing protein [Chryseolinea sp. T2]|uniref:AsmA family protein n=1 Tax=Chryseolinea sp. T2 TaxID=3129255 RepID=UPI003076EEA4
MKVAKVLTKWIVYALLSLVALLGVGVIMLNVYKQEILAKINAKLQETVEGEVKIGDYHVTMLHAFPHLSITLNDIYLHGPQYAHFHKPFLTAKRLHLNIVSHRLFIKDIDISSVDIEDGEIFVFRTRAGYTNTDVFKARKNRTYESQREPAVIDLHKINLNNIKLVFHDSLKLKHLGVDFRRTENDISSANGSTQLHTRGNLTFHGLMLNAEKGSFLRDIDALTELNIEIDSTLSHITVHPSKVIFDKAAVDLKGNFNLREQRKFDLSISSDNVDHQEALHIVHDTLASKINRFNINGPIRINVEVKGVMQAGIKPAVDVLFTLRNTQVSFGKLNANHVDLHGTFNNHINKDVPNDENNARLHFEKFKGIVDNIPVEASVTLTDMKDPHLDLKAVFDTPLRNLNENFDSTTLQFRKGHFRSAFSYSGKLSEYMDENITEYHGKLTGQATITDGAFNYRKRNYRVSNVNAVFDFTENVFAIKALNLTVNSNDLSITGDISDFIPFFIQPKGNAKLKLAIVSPKIDITGFSKPRIVVSKQRAKAKIQKSKEKMVDIVDRLNEQLDLDVTFNIGQFINRNFKASQLKGQLLLANNQFLLKDLSMNFGGGHVALNTHIREVDKKISPISIRAKAKDIALKDFFNGFNNFNQKTFTQENIDGTLTLDIDLSSAINEKLDLQMSMLQGKADFSIYKMRLTDFEPMQRLSNFLMKGRDFSDVSFNDIKSSVGMQNTKMVVSRMEVESTVISMFIEGVYDLGDSTDLAVQVPLSNLKKRDQDIPPENIGTDSRVGPSVFLRVRTGKDGKTAISYDPFKKFRKNKKNKKDNAV